MLPEHGSWRWALISIEDDDDDMLLVSLVVLLPRMILCVGR